MRRRIDLIILLLVLAAGVLAALNAQTIGDWIHARQYTPPAEIAELADDSGMNQTGQKLFFRFSPQLIDQTELDQVCNTKKLGCTQGRSIYILKAPEDDTSGHNRAVVTAAHEMLHVAYSRLNDQERQSLQPLLDAELARPVASDIVKQLQDYPQEDYYNEAHSFIGSELPGISSDLEAHYSQYFSDRSKSTDAFAHSPDR